MNQLFPVIARQLLVFAHLGAFAFAVVTIIREDLALFNVRRVDAAKLAKIANMTKWLLVALWLTGVTLILMDVGLQLSALLTKPKLIMKIIVVLLLTVNGWLLHSVAFPMLTRPQKRPHLAAAICCVMGAVSAVSWVYAALVGAARYMAPKMTFMDFLDLYLLALAAGIGIALTIARPQVERLMLPIKNTRDGRTDRRQTERRQQPRRASELTVDVDIVPATAAAQKVLRADGSAPQSPLESPAGESTAPTVTTLAPLPADTLAAPVVQSSGPAN